MIDNSLVSIRNRMAFAIEIVLRFGGWRFFILADGRDISRVQQVACLGHICGGNIEWNKNVFDKMS